MITVVSGAYCLTMVTAEVINVVSRDQTSDSTTSPMVLPLVLNQHLRFQWLFFLYSAIVYYPNGCSSCTLTSFTGTMLVAPIVKHHPLVQMLFLLYSTILYWSNGCSSCTPLSCSDVLYHHRLTIRLFSLYAIIIY